MAWAAPAPVAYRRFRGPCSCGRLSSNARRRTGHPTHAKAVVIDVVPYRDEWPGLFQSEARRLAAVFGPLAVRIDHVGSTAVPGLAAKPVIDIQASLVALEPRTPLNEALADLGYQHVDLGDFDRVYPFFARPKSWPSTHHLHLCLVGSREERRHLAFRDALRTNPELARRYEELKRALAARHHGRTLTSREGYSLAKSAFVEDVLRAADSAA